ncbi:hypothetical protein JYU34_012257 [Plutella xylostella]|uniref:Ectonucleoside triphosphate diphosphohydrolase 5 n=1 Tax=Plutella xylostella TaxID=51655 RepID=A0ABQ7QEQ7_PLUXY|nr:nucleoside-diphosphatase uda-1 isoform X2 [Plutella xylostella]KAG7303700.1 hypothetical protein JYU34_012257 [Plutella xylostella]
MSEIRQRKLKDDSAPAAAAPRARSLAQPRRLRKVFVVLIIAAVCATYFTGLFAGQSRLLDGLARSLGYRHEHHYAVLVDAGSSGSRVLAYKFRVPFTVFGQVNLDLEDEYFEQSKPGLSSYADEPEKGADSIVQLIKKASFLIPEDKRAHTPLIVRATAGLRLLPREKADGLIVAVRAAIAKLGYNTDGDSSVEIMDGADEGIYIWYTVNLLHNLLGGSTMAALDLGGGSTQITYQLDEELAARVPAGDRHAVPTGGVNISVYTHSYLGLGLYAARYGILQLGNKTPNTTHFTSPCVDPIVTDERWTYANKEIVVSGLSPGGTTAARQHAACRLLVAQYVKSTLDWEPEEPPRGSVAAMSFFYDVAADAGLIDVMRGGKVTIGKYKHAAQQACGGANIEQPWACMDLVYIVTLLNDAYKMSLNHPISLYKKVNGHEVSWALGLAYTTIMNRINVK